MAIFLVILTVLSLVSLAQGDTCHKIVTSNVGLTESVGNTSARAVTVANTFANLDADVVCAQEFWHEEDMDRVIRASSANFPYHYSSIHDSQSVLSTPNRLVRRKESACTYWEATVGIPRLLRCAAQHCGNTTNPIAQGSCVVGSCVYYLRSLSRECGTCFFLSSAASFTTAIQRCSDNGGNGRRFNLPGLFLMSKKRIQYAGYRSYFSRNRVLLERGMIYAEIEDVGKVVCTHLSANVGGFFEYDSSFTNYEDMQTAEINFITRSRGREPHMLMGDLNTGPVRTGNANPEKNLAGEFSSNYARLESLGYRSPYVDQVGKCTYCSDNPIINGRSPNNVLDHVLLMGDNYRNASAERFLDFTTPLPMSDHYAVRVNVCQN